MNVNLLAISLNALWGGAYLAIAYLMIRRRAGQEQLARYLIGYSLVGFGVQLVVFLCQVGVLQFIHKDVIWWLPYFGVAVLALLFLAFTEEFLAHRQASLWVYLGAVWIGMLLFLIAMLPSFPVMFAGTLAWWVVVLGVLLLGWGGVCVRTGILIFHEYHNASQSMQKARFLYWGMILALMALGDILLFSGLQAVGSGLRMAAMLIGVYVILTYQVAEPSQVGQGILSYLINALIGAGLYVGVFLALQTVFRDTPGFNVTTLGIALAVVLAMLVNPLLGRVNQSVNRLVFGAGYDPSAIVRGYSQEISNIVDLQRLAETSLGRIQKAMDVRDGVLFRVDQEKGQERSAYRLQPIKALSGKEIAPGRLQPSNPMAIRFCTRPDPLLQYEMEMQPEFRDMAVEEQLWISELGAAVFVPICGQGRWNGLIVLGPLKSGRRYSEQDLSLLSTLADQTVVALENARLVNDLNKVNTDLEKAYEALAKANQNLREIDRLKSSFIGVITHELRTPLSNVGFALQIFEMYGLNHLIPDQREQYQQLKASYQVANRLIENLVTFAAFLNNQVKLAPERMNVRDLLREVLSPLKILADEKGIDFKVEVVGEIPPLNADHKLITNAMYQLVHNAIKFTNSGGKVSISCWASSNWLCFDVKDTGVGIPTERMQEMWNEFTQMVDPLKRGLEGLGLGLALVKHIVAAHGGEVWAESQVGSGSMFGFQVPLLSARQAKRVSEIFRKRVAIQP